MRVLVTGSEGFIGRHFATHFEQHGHRVKRVDIRDPDYGRRFDCRIGFIREAWRNADLVIHAAATIPPIDERERNQLAVANDLAIDAAMFQWAAATKPDKIVYFSSSAAYPAHLQQPKHKLTEDDLNLDMFTNPDAMYGLTKLVGELQARELRKLGVEVLVVRPFSGYGEDQDASYPFPAMIDRALCHQDPFPIWGSGHQVRDFVHVDDIVGSVQALLDAGAEGPVNIGTGVPITMFELAHQVCLAADHKPQWKVHEDKPVGVQYRCADISLMECYYTPTVTLEEGIVRALKARRR
jgi:nucleoside-diphosphate-sugar epimerase